MKMYCPNCRKIQSFGEVGKIERRPLVVFECSNCARLQIQTEETVDLIKWQVQVRKNVV